MDFLCQVFARKFAAQAAELHAVLPGATVNGASAGVRPLLAVTVGFNAALAQAVGLLSAAGAAFATSRDGCKVDLVRQ